MDQGLINLLLGLAIPVTSILTLILEKYFNRKKSGAEYGNEILELANKTALSLKQAREELESMTKEVQSIQDDHEKEIELLRGEQKARIDRMKVRILDLEKVVTTYEISFTLQTRPHVQINDLKVTGREDVSESQRLRAIRPEDVKKP